MMRRIVLLTVGVLLAMSGYTQSVSAQGVGVYVGPGGPGVSINPGYRDRDRDYDYDRPRYRERREFREQRCRTTYIQDQYGSRRVTRCY
jgi:hypothetical protein